MAIDDDSTVVQPVFERVLRRVWDPGFESLQVFAELSPQERAVYATRVLEGEIENGGWYQAYGNGVEHLIEPAIAGYELLGLPEYALHLRHVVASGFSTSSPDSLGAELDDAFFRLSGSESARAMLILRHPPNA